MVVFTIVSSNYYTFDKNSHRLAPLLLSCVSTERVCSRSYDSKTLVPTLLTDKRHFLVLHLCLKRQPKECAVVLTIANSDSHAFLTGEPRNVTILAPSPFARESTERVCSRSNDSIFQLLYSLKR